MKRRRENILESTTGLTTQISYDQELSTIKKEINNIGMYDNCRLDFYSRNTRVTSG